MIPMVDLKGQYLALKDEIDSAIAEVLDSTRFILGPNVQAFEREAAEYLGVAHAVSCASGTDALHLALLAAGIGPGDEVITTPFTFIATAEAISYVGAEPIFVDIEPDTFNIDPNLIEPAITPRTRAIIPVHLFGQPADMDAITQIAKRHDLLVIEDVAQAFGAAIEGTMTGAIGLAGCHSFFPSKNLGCYGDGGLVTTSSDEVADKLRMLRNHGSNVRYHHDVIGYNSRLDELQAAILRVKLRHIDEFNTNRRRAAHTYSRLLSGIVIPPHEDGKGNHVYHQYTILSDARDAIMETLTGEQISCAIYYPIPLHRQKVYQQRYEDAPLPVSEDVARHCLSLPVYPELEDSTIENVVASIKAAV
ncbi:MAG: DegT/DnrJ/EryC1/StrS family aminotransferase [Pseudomonadota bacterium]|nr:MAG: DegT/DnrJ/EryC1/StrS family aminotransferase [Pseudomonadota bacterium]